MVNLSVYTWASVSMIIIAFSLFYVNVFSGNCEQIVAGFSDVVILQKDFARFSDGTLELLVSNARPDAVIIEDIVIAGGATEFDFPATVETGNTISVKFVNLQRSRRNSCTPTEVAIKYSYGSQKNISSGTLSGRVK